MFRISNKGTAHTDAPASPDVVGCLACSCGTPDVRLVHLIDLGTQNGTGSATICDRCCRVLSWSHAAA